MHKQWAEAERRHDQVVGRYPDTRSAAEAAYWRGVSRYKATNDHAVLAGVADLFKKEYRDSIWAKKASVWSA